MQISKQASNIIGCISIFSLLSMAFYISRKASPPVLFISKQQSSLNVNESIVGSFSLGQKRLISSLLWISTILESDQEHYKNKDLNSWMFLRFKTISSLEPNFFETYNFGGPYLSIIKNDLAGADYIYNKGLHFYPDNYSLLANAGFHFYFESKKTDSALKAFQKISNNPKSPPWVLTSLAKIQADNGDKKVALTLLTDYQNRLPEGHPLTQRIYEYRYDLKANLDLECLNSNTQEKCEMFDLDGNPYIKKDGKFSSRKTYKGLEERK